MTKRGGRQPSIKPGLDTAGEARSAGRSHDSERRPLRFWQPFNDWWRAELEHLGRRPNAQEILGWYTQHAADTWKEDAPSLQETRVHAKCLRSLPLVRDYFRNYRAKKRSGGERAGSLTPGEAPDYRQYRDYSHGSDGDQDPDPDYTPDRGFPPRGRAPRGYGYGGAGHEGEDYGEGDDGDLEEDDAVALAGLAQLAKMRDAESPEQEDEEEEEGEDADGGAGGGSNRGRRRDSGSQAPEVATLPPPLPGLASLLAPSAAALWSAAAGAGAAPPQLLRGLTLQQLQQQLALAALAQNLGVSGAAPLGLQVLAAQQQQQQAVSHTQEAGGAGAQTEDAGPGAEEDTEQPRRRRRQKEELEVEGRRRGAGRGDRSGPAGRGGRAAAAPAEEEEEEADAEMEGEDEETGHGELDPLPYLRSVPKRRRTGCTPRRRFGGEGGAEEAGPHAPPCNGAEHDGEAAFSGRWEAVAAALAGADAEAGWRGNGRGGAALPLHGLEGDADAAPRGPRGRGSAAGGATRRGGPKRHSRFASDQSDEAEAANGNGGVGAMTGTAEQLTLLPPPLPPLPLLDAPAGFAVNPLALPPPLLPPPLPPLPREVLNCLSREALVDRVLALQQQLALMWEAQQALQLHPHQPQPQHGAPPPDVQLKQEQAEHEAVVEGQQQPLLPPAGATAAVGAQLPPSWSCIHTVQAEGRQGDGDTPTCGRSPPRQQQHLQEGCEQRQDQAAPDSGLPLRPLPGPRDSGLATSTTAAPCEGQKVDVCLGGPLKAILCPAPAAAAAAATAASSGDNGGSPAGPASTDGDGDSRVPELAVLPEATAEVAA